MSAARGSSSRGLGVLVLMLMGIGAHDPLCPSPLLDRPVLGEGFELSFPKFAIRKRAGICAYQTLASALGGSAHADLSNIVLDPDDVGFVFAVNILNSNVSPQHGFAQFLIGAPQFSGPCYVTGFILFSFVAVGDMHDVELEAGVRFIVDGHAPDQMVAVAGLEASHVGPAELVGAYSIGGKHGVERNAPIAFLGFDL